MEIVATRYLLSNELLFKMSNGNELLWESYSLPTLRYYTFDRRRDRVIFRKRSRIYGRSSAHERFLIPLSLARARLAVPS